MTTSDLTREIMRAARASLGRPAKTSGATPDWDAAHAVEAAAKALGLTEPLESWVPSRSASLTGLSECFVYRYRQSYGKP